MRDMRRMPADEGPASAPTREPRAALPGPPLLDLQRRAGNRAVSELLRRSSKAPPGTVQRDVGFEFELNVPFLEPSTALPNGVPEPMQTTYGWLLGKGDDPKEVVEDFGFENDADGFKIVAEDGTIEDQINNYRLPFFKTDYWIRGVTPDAPASIPELVTRHIDERDPNAMQLFHDQLSEVASTVQSLAGEDPANQSSPFYGWTLGIPADLRYPMLEATQDPVAGPDHPNFRQEVDRRRDALRGAVNLAADMQATVGIDLKYLSPALDRKDEALLNDYGRLLVDESRSCFSKWVEPVLVRELGGREGLTDTDRNEIVGFMRTVVQYVAGDVLFCHCSKPGVTQKNLTPFWIRMDLTEYRDRLTPGAVTAIRDLCPQIRELMVGFHQSLRVFYEPTRVTSDGKVLSLIGGDVGTFVERVFFGNDDGFDEDRMHTLDVIDGVPRGMPVELRHLPYKPAPTELYEYSMGLVRKFRRWVGIED